MWLNPLLNLTIFRGTGPRTLAPDTTVIHSTRNSWQVMGSSLQLLINPEKAAKLLFEDEEAEKSSFQHFSAVFLSFKHCSDSFSVGEIMKEKMPNFW